MSEGASFVNNRMIVVIMVIAAIILTIFIIVWAINMMNGQLNDSWCSSGCGSKVDDCNRDKNCTDWDYLYFADTNRPSSISWGDTIADTDFEFLICNCASRPISFGSKRLTWTIINTTYSRTGMLTIGDLPAKTYIMKTGKDAAFETVVIQIPSLMFLEHKTMEIVLGEGRERKIIRGDLEYITQLGVQAVG